LRTAVLISGRGSNLQALIDYAAAPGAAAEIALVVSNVPDAPGLKRALKANIPTLTIDHREFSGREPFEERLTADLEQEKIDFICLAGFMRILTETFVGRWRDRLINIHPSLLPAYKGLNTHRKVLEDGVRFAGCTVHFVRPAMDSGPIIVQAVVPVAPDDDEEALAARVLHAEHRCYPLALRLIAEDRVEIVDELVKIQGGTPPDIVLVNPLAPEEEITLSDPNDGG
jgi:phosphoribosylglycinamide formyltransferase-1